MRSRSAPAVSRSEAALVLLLLFLGAGLRLWAPERMGVEHFDEGVYASNLWFDAEEGYQYPNRPLYAPPLLPFLIECSLLVFGPAGFAPMVPSLAAGCGTVTLVWWAARQWFGPAAGLAAAALAATSEIHILYSRAALTDVMLCFWWLAAVALAERAFRRARLDDAVFAGAFAGLAWWTKYNGWLAVGVALGGAVCWMLFGRGERQQTGRIALAAALLLVTALVVWSPVLIGLEDFPGGYGAVAANHAKYVVGLDGWLASTRSQLAALAALEGPWTLAGVAIAIFAAMLLGRRIGVEESIELRRSGPGPWMLLVWIAGLTFATPLYHPYPRLALPWVVAVWLVLGAAIGWLAGRSVALPRVRWSLVTAGGAALAAAVFVWIGSEETGSVWQPHSGLRTVAERVVQDIVPSDPGGEAAVVLVYAEPALIYHLNAVQFGREGRVLAAPVARLDFGAFPEGARVFLAAGLHARQSETFLSEVGQSRFTSLAEYPYVASDLVLSDHFPPAVWDERRQQSVTLYQAE